MTAIQEKYWTTLAVASQVPRNRAAGGVYLQVSLETPEHHAIDMWAWLRLLRPMGWRVVHVLRGKEAVPIR